MTAYTTPDQLPYPDDYQQPADTPAVVGALATATQAALAKRTADIAAAVAADRMIVCGPFAPAGSDAYRDITTVGPTAWQPFWSGIRFNTAMAGWWRITFTGHMEIQGGTSQTLGARMQGEVLHWGQTFNGTMRWSNGGKMETWGRLSAPVGERVLTEVSATGWFYSDGSAQVACVPVAHLIAPGPVAGGYARLGALSITAQVFPGAGSRYIGGTEF